MAYKRKAHVLFVASGDVSRPLLAVAAAHDVAADWIEARAVCLTPQAMPEWLPRALAERMAAGAPLPQDLDAGLLAWADLLVSLDEAAQAACVARAPQVPHRHYPLAVPADCAGLRELGAGLRERIAGMAGGMRMLARSG